MKLLFWICWSVEITAALCWMINEMKQPYALPGPWAFIIALYLVIVLAVRFGFDAEKASVVLVALPAMPLLLIRLLFSNTPYREVATINR